MSWFDVDAASRAFTEGAGEGVRLLAIIALQPAGRGLEATFSYDGFPGREFKVKMQYKTHASGSCADLAKMMGRRAAAEIDIECRC